MRMTREDYDDASLYIQDQMRQRRNRLRLIFALILGILLALVLFFLTYFRVRYVTVEGSAHYTDEEVEQQIALLRDDPDVRLAQKATRVAYRRRRYLYNLQADKRRGTQLREAGITYKMLDEQEKLMGRTEE